MKFRRILTSAWRKLVSWRTSVALTTPSTKLLLRMRHYKKRETLKRELYFLLAEGTKTSRRKRRTISRTKSSLSRSRRRRRRRSLKSTSKIYSRREKEILLRANFQMKNARSDSKSSTSTSLTNSLRDLLVLWASNSLRKNKCSS